MHFHNRLNVKLMHKCTYKTGNGASQAGSSAMPTENKIENIYLNKGKV